MKYKRRLIGTLWSLVLFLKLIVFEVKKHSEKGVTDVFSHNDNNAQNQHQQKH